MRHTWAAACMVAALMLSTSAWAQAEEEPPEDYRTHIDRALKESEAGRWEEARVAFREAHALYPNARTLRGIGLVAFEIRDYVDAVRHLRAALDEPRRALDPEQRNEAESLLQRALNLVARYDTSALPPDASIVVDGRPARREADGTLLLSLGEHRVQVQSAAQRGEGLLTVRGGETGPLPVVLEAPAAAPAPAPIAPEPAVTTMPAPPLATSTTRDDGVPTGALLLTIAGGVIAVTGTVLLVLGLDDVSTVENADASTEWSSLRDAHDAAPLLTGVGGGLLALGGALGVTGVVWWVADDAGGSEPAAGLTVGGRW